MSLRFKVGEIAIYCNLPAELEHENGMEVEVVAIRPEWISALDDYEVLQPNGEKWSVRDDQLRKRPQPGIPESVRSWFEVKQG